MFGKRTDVRFNGGEIMAKTDKEMIKYLWERIEKLKYEKASLHRKIAHKRRYYAFCPLCGKKMKETKTGWECLHNER